MEIRIANPRLGGVQFTSHRAAAKYIRKKIAVMNADGELFFHHGHRRDMERQDTVTEIKAAAKRLGKVLFWNGEDTDDNAIHVPGEVRC